MSLVNNILLRPHTFDTRARAVSPESDIASILMDTVARILKDVRGDQAIITHIWELAQEGVNALMEKVIAQLSSSLDELKALVQPILDFITAIAEAAGASDFGAGFASVIGLLVDKIVDLSRNFSLDALEALLLKLAGIANRALGLTDGSLANIVEGAVDHITEGLMAAFLGGDNSTAALDSFMIGNNIRQLKEYFKDFLQQQNISLDLSEPVKSLILMLRKKGIDEKLRQIREYVETIGGGASFIGSLSGTLSISFNAPRPSGPAPIEDPVGWYVSWFNSSWRTDMIGIEDRFDLNKWRTPAPNVTNPRTDHPEDWDATIKDRIAFENSSLTPEVMEKVAHISYLVGDFIEALMHTISLGGKPYAGSIFNLVTQAWKGSLTAALGNNNDQSWVNAYKVLGHNWFDYGLQMLGTFALGWIPEGNLRLSGNPLYYLLSGVRSMGEVSFIANYVWLARESLLSILTLINTNSTLNSTKDNYLKSLGLTNLLSDVGCWIGAAFPWRDNFGLDKGGFVKYMFLGSIPGLLFPFFGLSITHSYGSMTGGHVGNVMGQAASTTLFKWFLYWNIMWENNTDGGMLRGFLGYPPKENSPYLMPMVNGKELGMVQGNLGFFSHHKPGSGNDLTYAYDFTHDFQDEVLAIRAGNASFTLADELYRDDKLQNSGNAVYVDHVLGIDPIHDRGLNGVVGQTKAKYYHGAHMGISHAFAMYGIPTNFINGVAVRQGQVIMLAGSTGNSGHNHLHLDVSGPGAETIPFVFRDAPGDGVPKTAGWYTGTQARVPTIASATFPIYHPLKERGNTAADGTTDKVKLNDYASPHDDWYKGSYILVAWTSTDGIPRSQYRKITAYDPDDQTITVTPDWDILPLAGATYQIGSPHHSESTEFEKQFGYWGLNGADPFEDGKPVFRYVNIARYQTTRFSGTIGSASVLPGDNSVQIVLPLQGPIIPASMPGRFIVIRLNGTMVAYKEILSYTAGTTTVTILGTWGIPFDNTYTYEIGGQKFADSTFHEETTLTYYCPDSTPGTFTPIDFTVPNPAPSAKRNTFNV